MNVKEHDIVQDIITVDYIHNLIYGNAERAKALTPLARKYGVDLVPNVVMTLICDDFLELTGEMLDNRKRYKIKQQLLSVTRKMLAQTGLAALAITLIGTERIIVLADCGGEQMAEDERSSMIMNCAKTLQEAIKTKTSYSVSIGISRFFDDIDKTWLAYEESFQALKYIFFRGKSAVILYSTINSETGSDFISSIQKSISQELIIVLTKANYDGILQIVGDMIDYFLRQNYSEVRIKSEISLLLFNICEYYGSVNIRSGDEKDNLKLTMRVFRMNSLAEVHELLVRYLMELACEIQCMRKGKTELSLELAAAYIERYYSQDLQLKDVATLVGYNPSYFSRVFAAKYSISFVEKLTQVRIDAAKELLENSELSVAAVSEKAGYTDQNYFSSVFKKKVGVSPNQYRKEAKEKQQRQRTRESL